MKIFRYILLVAILLGNYACNDMLDRYPKNTTNSEVFFNSENDLQLYSNQFYAILPEAGELYGELSDEIVTTTLTNEVMGTRTIASGEEYWTWEMLRHINYLLQHSNQCVDVTARNHYEGVAYFFRAFFYFEKVKHFGDVPWYDTPIGSGDEAQLKRPRDSRQTVIANVINDLDKAADLLPEAHSVYTINKWTALALKSRVCLFEGTFRKYHGIGNYEALLQACAEASKKLMDEGGYTLYNTGAESYRDLFARDAAEPNEIILSRRYNAALGLTHNATSYTVSITQGSPGFTKRFVNKYLKKDGTAFTAAAGYDTLSIHDEMVDRDPRMWQTVFHPGTYVRKGESDTARFSMKTSITGYQIIKYAMTSQYDVYNSSECDMPLFRIAEAYLNYAEAKAELGTLTQDDIDKSIKLLRTRVGMPNLDIAAANANPDSYMAGLYPNVSQNACTGALLEIRRERDIELVMEGFRYYDLMRWKEGKAFTQPFHGQYFGGEGRYDFDGNGTTDLVLWATSKPLVFGADYLHMGEDIVLSEGNKGCKLVHGTQTNPSGSRTFDEARDYLLPIPINDRILTEGALTQNPGWDDKLSF